MATLEFPLDYLDGGGGSIGTRIEFDHRSATLLGVVDSAATQQRLAAKTHKAGLPAR